MALEDSTIAFLNDDFMNVYANLDRQSPFGAISHGLPDPTRAVRCECAVNVL